MENAKQQTNIYIGLNDRETGVQKTDTEKYLLVLKDTCRHYKVSFSFQLIHGGFFHIDGKYVEENTLMLTLIDVPEDTIMEIAKDLCVFFNQESVMVVTNPASAIIVKESL